MVSFDKEPRLMQGHVWLYILSILLSCLVYTLWKKRHFFYFYCQLPGPIWVPYIAQSLLYMSVKKFPNTLWYLERTLKKYRPSKLIRLVVGSNFMVIVADADVAAKVNATHLVKGENYRLLGAPFLETGIFVDEDIPHWKASRKIISQVLHFRILKYFIPIFHDEVLILMDKLQSFAQTGQSIFLPKLFQFTTLNTISRTTLGIDQNAQVQVKQPMIHAIHDSFEHAQRKTLAPVYENKWLYQLSGYRKSELNSLNVMNEWCESVVKKTIEEKDKVKPPNQQPSLVELLLQHPEISMAEVKAQIATIIGAGLDTSMLQNSIVLLLLALHPEVQDKLHKEIVEVLGTDLTSCPDNDSLMKLDYLDRVLKETLRMFPAAPMISRKLTEDFPVTVDGKEMVFPKGIMMVIPIFYIQQSPDYYENPKEFDPDRWLPENIAQRNPHSYFPFSSGPRNCIGGKYALLQMKTFLVTILRRYELLPSHHCPTLKHVRVNIKVTMVLEDMCQVRLRERHQT